MLFGKKAVELLNVIFEDNNLDFHVEFSVKFRRRLSDDANVVNDSVDVVVVGVIAVGSCVAVDAVLKL